MMSMNGSDVMSDTSELSEARRTLLEKYVRGDVPQIAVATRAVTQYAEADVATPRECVVTIQIGGSKRPFFFLHGDWIDGAYWCFPLAHELGSDQPFYALEPYSFDGMPVPPKFEAIAAAHLKSLRSVQPEGPYLLGGFCNGALLAYEMARQLHTQGHRVDLLVLMDPMGLVYPLHNRLANGLVTLFGSLMRLDQEKQLNLYVLQRYIYNYLQHLYRYLRYPHYRRLKTELKARPVNPHGGAIAPAHSPGAYSTIQRLKTLYEYKLSLGIERTETNERVEPGHVHNKVGFRLPRLDSIFPDPFFPTTEVLRQDYPGVYDWIAMRYVPDDFYPGKITFFWDSEEPYKAGWRKVTEVNEVEVHVLPGSQLASRTRYLHVLAERLGACLSKAQATTLIEDDRSASSRC